MKNNLQPNGTTTPWQPNRNNTVNPSTPLPPDLTPDPLNRKLQSGQKLVGGSSDPAPLAGTAAISEGPNSYIPEEALDSTRFDSCYTIQGNFTQVGATIPIQKNICSMPLQYNLCYRRIYAHILLTATVTGGVSAAAYGALCAIRFFRGNSLLVELPLSYATGSPNAFAEPIFTMATTGGAVVNGSIGLYKPDNSSWILQPQDIYTHADSVQVDMIKVQNIQDIYVALAVISSNKR